MELLLWVLGVVLFIVVLMLSVAVHEGGHLVAARSLGLSVKKFFVGFGPTLISRKWGNTEYGIKGIPLGGFVQVEDDATEDEAERMLLSNVSPWKRIIVFVAGPAVNIVIGLLILYGSLLVYPVNQLSSTVDQVNDGGAKAAGIMAGDDILAINGQNVDNGEFVGDVLKAHAGPHDVVTVTVERNGQTFPVQAQLDDHMLGVQVAFEEVHLAPVAAAVHLGDYMVTTFEHVIMLPTKVVPLIEAMAPGQDLPENAPGSMIQAGNTYGDTMATPDLLPEDKVQQFVFYTGAINLGLGLINLVLPFLPLDGGRILIAFIDMFRGFWARVRAKEYTPLGTKTVGIMTAVTGVVLMGFFLLVMVSDVIHIARGNL
jgi:membrane-associated protease RseP (regulator of RpoE activity)